MAATQESIWFDYQQAIAQADALDEIAGRIERTSRGELEDGLRVASGNWKGDSASRFRSKGERLQGQYEDTARALRKAAEEVRETAERIRRTELANLEIVMERTY